MATYEITHDLAANACIVHLVGDVDAAMVPDLRRNMEAALDGGCANVVLDLTDVDYADSSALGLLVWIDHVLRPRGGRMVLAGATRDVARILELSGLVTVAASIAMAANVPAALEGFDMAVTPSDPLWKHEAEFAADIDSLAGMREEICEIVRPLGFPESALFDIKVALGEALANAVRHGSPSDGSGRVEVRVIAYPDRIVLEVTDNGEGFDGTHEGAEDLYAPGGRGIMFMRALMDRVEFERSPSGGTTVRLAKHRVPGALR